MFDRAKAFSALIGVYVDTPPKLNILTTVNSRFLISSTQSRFQNLISVSCAVPSKRLFGNLCLLADPSALFLPHECLCMLGCTCRVLSHVEWSVSEDLGKVKEEVSVSLHYLFPLSLSTSVHFLPSSPSTPHSSSFLLSSFTCIDLCCGDDCSQ